MPTLLIIDDSADIHHQLRFWLEPEGLTLLSAYRGDEGLKTAQQTRPDLVLVDVRMPDCSGFDLCIALKSNPLTQGIPIIFLTGETDVLNKVKGLNLGATDYITKPFNPAELQVRVRTILRTKQLENSLVHEIDERKKAEQALLEHKDNLERLVAQRTQDLVTALHHAENANHAKNRFLAVMSHELRTPLNIILGYCDLLLEPMTQQCQADEVEDLLKIQQSGFHLLHLLEQILRFAEVEEGKQAIQVAEFDLSLLLDEVIQSINPLLQQNHNQLTRCYPPSLLILQDPIKIRHIVLTLIGNAAKFTQQGRIQVQIKQNPDQWILRVQDSGIGIAPDFVSQIFQPFEQQDTSSTRRYGGSGLSLALSQRYCHLLGGTLTFDSVVGQGTVFYVQLPYAASLNRSALG